MDIFEVFDVICKVIEKKNEETLSSNVQFIVVFFLLLLVVRILSVEMEIDVACYKR